MSEIYDRIRARRLELGMSLEELAHAMGYKDKSSISKIEHGKADIPQSKVAVFARVLHTTTGYLLGIDTPAVAVPPGLEPTPESPASPPVAELTSSELAHLDQYRQLNAAGQSRVDAYTDDLVATGKYIKDHSVSATA